MHMTPGGSGYRRLGRLSAVAGLAAVVLVVVTLPGCGPRGAGAVSHGPARTARPGQDGLIVSTQDGKLQGKHAEGVDQFLGVPYAAPPVGALRWQAPEPVRPWQGIRDAMSYGRRCPQQASSNGPREDTENCLYLNLFTPVVHTRTSPPGAARRGGGLPGT